MYQYFERLNFKKEHKNLAKTFQQYGGFISVARYYKKEDGALLLLSPLMSICISLTRIAILYSPSSLMLFIRSDPITSSPHLAWHRQTEQRWWEAARCSPCTRRRRSTAWGSSSPPADTDKQEQGSKQSASSRHKRRRGKAIECASAPGHLQLKMPPLQQHKPLTEITARFGVFVVATSR